MGYLSKKFKIFYKVIYYFFEQKRG